MRLRDFDPNVERALQLLFEQRGVELAVYLVSNGSDMAALRRNAAPFRASVVKYPSARFSYSRSLNLGFAQVQEPYVLSFSSHCSLHSRDLLRALADELSADPKVGAVSLQYRPEEGENSGSLKREEVSLKQFTGLNGAHNPCALYRKSDWEDQPFDEEIPTVEDQQWSFQWLSKSPEHRIVHLATAAFSRAAKKNPISKPSRDVFVASLLFQKPEMMRFQELVWRSVLAHKKAGHDSQARFAVRRILIYARCMFYRLWGRKVHSFTS